jgi:hypothetical protein
LECVSRPFRFEDLPLGETKAIELRSQQLLKLDDYLYRSFRTKGNLELTVFIAFWRPGSVGLRGTGNHNPDVCWTGSGWKELQRIVSGTMHFEQDAPDRISTELPSGRVLHDAAFPKAAVEEGRSSASMVPCVWEPIEYRLFESPGNAGTFHTYFWNVWAGEVTPVEHHSSISYYRDSLQGFTYFRSLYKRFKASSSPRYFIRIHSSMPLAPVDPHEERQMDDGSSTSKLSSPSPKSSPLRHPTTAGNVRYLSDDPDVRALLMSIHSLTTSGTP